MLAPATLATVAAALCLICVALMGFALTRARYGQALAYALNAVIFTINWLTLSNF
jgi:hypothetical protein